MLTNNNESSRPNNYVFEPQMYLASFPSPEQQQRYLRQGGFAVLLITSLLMIAIAVS